MPANDKSSFLGPPMPAENTSDHSDSSTRKGEAQGISPLSALQHGEVMAEHKLFSDNAGFTGPQAVLAALLPTDKRDDRLMGDVEGIRSPVPDICIEDVSDNANVGDKVGVVVSPHEETSESASAQATPPPDDGVKAEHDCGPKIGSKLSSLDAMVTGHIPRPDSLAGLQVPSPGQRRKSLQTSTEGNSHLAVHGHRRRANSDFSKIDRQGRKVEDSHKQECSVPSPLDNEPPRPVYQRSVSGPPDTPISDAHRFPQPLPAGYKPPAEAQQQENPESPQPPTPGTQTPLTPNSPKPPSPSKSSYKPPGIQRQESQGENEIVIGTFGNPKAAPHPHQPLNFAGLHTYTEQEQEVEGVLGGLNIEAGGGQEVAAVQVQHVTMQVPSCSELEVRSQVDSSDSQFQSGRGSSASEGGQSSSGCGSTAESETVDSTTLYQVHLLGHACNSKCYVEVGMWVCTICYDGRVGCTCWDMLVMASVLWRWVCGYVQYVMMVG